MTEENPCKEILTQFHPLRVALAAHFNNPSLWEDMQEPNPLLADLQFEIDRFAMAVGPPRKQSRALHYWGA